ncbi:MAG: phosphoenolpyruvate synthase regulatory protein [Paenibacillaceae bacterium ZCTH02-B3]|nr:MAG: phosphoenolpyruvate synthase regulatory protein [Paenibacillaceae bacterium ZCTH02-B3]
MEPLVTVHVVSDAAGETGEHAVRAAAAQFPGGAVAIRRSGFVQNREAIDRVLEEAQGGRSVIVYTLVVPELKNYLVRRARRLGIPVIDLLGPLLETLEQTLGKSRNEPGLLRALNAEYFRKVEAIEFAVRYDDARDPSGILKADIVLIGVSRTSKTPLSMVLANKMFKVANVPLVPELEPPPELFAVPSRNVVGLTIRPEALNAIRKERLKALGLPDDAAYAKPERIEQELEYAHKIMKKIGCVVIDVSNRAVEESASVIADLFRDRKPG